MKNKLMNKDIIVNCETKEEFDLYKKVMGIGDAYLWDDFAEKPCFHWPFIYRMLPCLDSITHCKRYHPNKKIIKFKDLQKKKAKKKNNKLVLEFEKVVVKGELKYKLTGVVGLNECDLPNEYKLWGNYVEVYNHYLGRKLSLVINNPVTHTTQDVSVGDIYTRVEKAKIVEFCKAAGSRLAKINKKIRLEKKKADWCGVEIVEI